MCHANQSLVKYDDFFQRVYRKVGRQSSMLYIMMLLKFLGSSRNAMALQKIGHMMGILKGSVNEYVMQHQACKGLHQE